MQAIGMYGYVDKYDFVIATAKTLEIMGRSVLVIDATSDEKYKYIIPSIDKSQSYLTQYADIDFAIGFNSYEELMNYLNEKGIDIQRYSYVLLDVENYEGYRKFKNLEINKSYMFIDTNVVSVARNEELIRVMRAENPEKELVFSKILYRAYMSRAANNYLEEKIGNYAVRWTDETYEISMDEQDVMVNIDSQYSGLIDIKKHTKTYILYLCEYISRMLGDVSAKEVLKEIKRRKN